MLGKFFSGVTGMKKSKFKMLSMAVAVFLAIAFCVTGCGGGKKPSGGGEVDPPPPTDEDPYVTALTILTPPTVTEYKVGQVFDYTGMTLSATWSHGETEELSPTECKRTPTGPLEAGVTAIVFTYEGATASQPITVIDRNLTAVRFDSSAIADKQLLGALDLTAVTVTAVYDDGSAEPVGSSQYVMTEGGNVIANPSVYVVTAGRHTIKVSFGGYEHTFAFTASFGFSVPLGEIGGYQESSGIVAKDDDKEKLIAEKKSFLFKPDATQNYGYPGIQNDEYCVYGIMNGMVMRFYIYMPDSAVAELVVRAASAQLLDESWDKPKKVGENKFNSLFEINRISVDPDTGAPVQDGGSDVKTPISVDDYIILPGATSNLPDGDESITGNFVDLSLGEFTFEAGYNVIEFKCISQHQDFMGLKRGCQFGGLTVRSAYTEQHTHTPTATAAVAPDCVHYGTEAYYSCDVCGRMYSDEACTERILAYKYVAPVESAHTADIAAPTCEREQKCTVCGKTLAQKAAHTFEQDLCSYEGNAECTVCHEQVKGGHVVERSKVKVGEESTRGNMDINRYDFKCTRCNKIIGAEIQAEDFANVKYKTKNGTEFTPGKNHAADLAGAWKVNPEGGGEAVFNGSETTAIVDLHDENNEGNSNWNGATIEIPVRVDVAGTYTFAIRCRSNNWHGDGGPATAQNLVGTMTYCANPGDTPSWQAVKGSAAPGSVCECTDFPHRWNNRLKWGVTEIGEVSLNAGNNKVVIKMPETAHIRTCDIDWFSFELKGKVEHPDAQVVSKRSGGPRYEAAATGGVIGTAKEILLETYMRIKLPDAKVQELGWTYEDVIITKEMYTAAGFSLDNIGTHTVTFSTEKYGKTYTADFTYTVYAAPAA